MDAGTQHYGRILKAKRARLGELEVQSAKYGIDTPPHVEMERVSLREEVEMLEKAIQSPARSQIVDELGVDGRYLVYYQQNRDVLSGVEGLRSENKMLRTILIVIGIAVVIILVAVAAIIGYLFARGGL